jgi:putative membrane protein
LHYIYFCLILFLAAIVAIFTFQNLEMVTVTFLTANITMPRALLIIIIYFLGMLTGGFMISLIRKWMRKSHRY